MKTIDNSELHSFTIRLPKKTWEKFSFIAKKEDMSMVQIINNLVEKFLKDNKKLLTFD